MIVRRKQGRPWARRPVLPLALLAVILVLGGEAGADPGSPDHLAELVALRAGFVEKIRQVEGAEEINALALATAGRTWALAAAALARSGLEYGGSAFLEEAEKDLAQAVSQKASPRLRQIKGLALMQSAVADLAGRLALVRGNKAVWREAVSIEEGVERADDPEKGEAHSLVARSNGLVSLLALTVQITDPSEKTSLAVEGEVGRTVAGARTIRQRPDLHYRGRLYMLALNNFQGCFRLMLLMNQAVDPRLAEEVEPISQALERNNGPGATPVQSMAVTLTALAEAGFPAAMVLVQE